MDIQAIRDSTDWREWIYCDPCGGIGSDDNANFWCTVCEGQGGRFDYPDERVMALVDVAETVADLIATAAELRRNIHPGLGLSYVTYREVWDASKAASDQAQAALTRLVAL